MWQQNIIALIALALCWIVILSAIIYIYKRQQHKAMPGKIILAYVAGLFSFSITITYFNEPLQIAVLPLGLWVLFFILIRRQSWEKYREYAWIGFFSNYLFLASTLLVMPLHAAIYTEDAPSTYIADISSASVLVTHSTAKPAELTQDALYNIQQAKPAQMYSNDWHYEVISAEPGEKFERFPYVLADAEAKRWSGYKPTVYIENDGRGLLIATTTKQFYFRTEQAILRGEGIK